MKRYLSILFFLTALTLSGKAQPLESQGIFEILADDSRDDFFGTQALLQGNLGRIVFVVDPKMMEKMTIEDVADWMKRGDLRFKNNAVRPRTNSFETGTQTLNGAAVLYVSMIAEIQVFIGLKSVNSQFEFASTGKDWLMAGTTPVSLSPNKVTYLRFNVIEKPKYKETTGVLDITVSGVAQATVTVSRLDGTDVITGDTETGKELVRTVVGGRLTLTNVLTGTYDIKATAPGFTQASINAVTLQTGATLPLPFTLRAETVPVQVFVKDSRNRVLTGYDLQVRTKTLESVRNEIEIPSDGFTMPLPPGDYILTIRKAGFISINQDLKVQGTSGAAAQVLNLVMKGGGAAANVKPIPVTVEVYNAKGSKLSKFDVVIKNEDTGDIRNYPMNSSNVKENLLPGEYTISVKKEEYDANSQRVVIAAGEKKRTVKIVINKSYKPKPTPKIGQARGGWGWLFLVAGAGAAGYYLTQQENASYGTPPGLPTL